MRKEGHRRVSSSRAEPRWHTAQGAPRRRGLADPDGLLLSCRTLRTSLWSSHDGMAACTSGQTASKTVRRNPSATRRSARGSPPLLARLSAPPHSQPGTLNPVNLIPLLCSLTPNSSGRSRRPHGRRVPGRRGRQEGQGRWSEGREEEVEAVRDGHLQACTCRRLRQDAREVRSGSVWPATGNGVAREQLRTRRSRERQCGRATGVQGAAYHQSR